MRPHMKTLKTVELGVLQTGGSKRSIVVSSITEAKLYAENGFSDILYGVPLGVDKIGILHELNQKFPDAKIHAMVDNRVIIDKMQELQPAYSAWSHAWYGVSVKKV